MNPVEPRPSPMPDWLKEIFTKPGAPDPAPFRPVTDPAKEPEKQPA